MRHFLPICLLTLALAGCSGTTPSAPWSDVFRQLNDEIVLHQQGYTALGEATQTIGHRLTGSENGHKAEEFAADFLRKAGYDNVTFDPFEVSCWQRGKVRLFIESAEDMQVFPCVALAHTPVKADTSAPLVWLGSGLSKDFEAVGTAAQGKFVLMSLQLQPADSAAKNLHRSEKTALAIKAGAAGVIFINEVKTGEDILLTGTCSTNGELVKIPVVCVSKSTGALLRQDLDAPVSSVLTIQMENSFEPVQARNVVARIEGRELPQETILIGGHLDSWDLATGAIDNGLGSFTVLEVARAFKALNLQPRRSIQFVMFMGEEQGLLGSKSLVTRMKEDGSLGSIRYMANLDMSGNADGFSFSGRKGEMEAWADSVGRMIAAIDTVFGNKNAYGAGLHSDHQHFLLQGVPVMGMVTDLDKSIYKCYHADCDTYELVNKTHMINGARFMAMMLYAIADAEKIPSQHLTEPQIKQFMVENGLQEELEVAGLWRW